MANMVGLSMPDRCARAGRSVVRTPPCSLRALKLFRLVDALLDDQRADRPSSEIIFSPTTEGPCGHGCVVSVPEFTRSVLPISGHSREQPTSFAVDLLPQGGPKTVELGETGVHRRSPSLTCGFRSAVISKWLSPLRSGEARGVHGTSFW